MKTFQLPFEIYEGMRQRTKWTETTSGTPLVIHNIERGTQEEDVLFQHQTTGHYRWK